MSLEDLLLSLVGPAPDLGADQKAAIGVEAKEEARFKVQLVEVQNLKITKQRKQHSHHLRP